MNQIKTTTRNAFLDMLVGDETYRGEIDSFLSAIINKNYNDMETRLNNAALFYLFILKPHLRQDFKQAIAEKKEARIVELTQRLFTT